MTKDEKVNSTTLGIKECHDVTPDEIQHGGLETHVIRRTQKLLFVSQWMKSWGHKWRVPASAITVQNNGLLEYFEDRNVKFPEFHCGDKGWEDIYGHAHHPTTLSLVLPEYMRQVGSEGDIDDYRIIKDFDSVKKSIDMSFNMSSLQHQLEAEDDQHSGHNGHSLINQDRVVPCAFEDTYFC